MWKKKFTKNNLTAISLNSIKLLNYVTYMIIKSLDGNKPTKDKRSIFVESCNNSSIS